MLRRSQLIFASLLLSFSSLFSIIGSTSASALEPGDVVVSINPSEQEIELKPGETYSGSIEVHNVGRRAFDFEVDVLPYQTADDDYNPDFSTENSYTRLKNWVKFAEPKYHVEPNYAAIVNFTVDVPPTTPGGGQYAAIIIRTLSPEEEASVQIVAQLASLLYAHVEGGQLREEGSLVQHSVPGAVWGSGYHITSVIKNTGNIDFKVNETLEIHDFFTKREVIVPSTTTDEGYPVGTATATVLPGTTRTTVMNWKDTPIVGLFRVKHTVSYLHDNYEVEKLVLVCPIWVLVISLITVTLIVIWIITSIRRRRRNEPVMF